MSCTEKSICLEESVEAQTGGRKRTRMLDRCVCSPQNRRFATIFLLASGLILFAMVPGAQASFIGDYALSNFTLNNIFADGSASSPDGTETLVLTGPNDGSGNFGITDYTVMATQNGLVQFDWSYSSLDTPTYDFAGYIINSAFTSLADTDGEFGTTSFSVNTGDVFGFRVVSLDNQGEPGILTVTDFSAPGDSSSQGDTVPEPAMTPVLAAVIGAALIGQRVARRRKEAGL